MDANFSVEPHDDGTVTLSHFGTKYNHWWLADLRKRKGEFTARIFGKTGGEALLWVSQSNAEALKAAVEKAKTLAAEAMAAEVK